LTRLDDSHHHFLAPSVTCRPSVPPDCFPERASVDNSFGKILRLCEPTDTIRRRVDFSRKRLPLPSLPSPRRLPHGLLTLRCSMNCSNPLMEYITMPPTLANGGLEVPLCSASFGV
jgi:hypothetical protein